MKGLLVTLLTAAGWSGSQNVVLHYCRKGLVMKRTLSIVVALVAVLGYVGSFGPAVSASFHAGVGDWEIGIIYRPVFVNFKKVPAGMFVRDFRPDFLADVFQNKLALPTGDFSKEPKARTWSAVPYCEARIRGLPSTNFSSVDMRNESLFKRHRYMGLQYKH